MSHISVSSLLNLPVFQASHQDLTKIWLDLHRLYENFHTLNDSVEYVSILQNLLIALLKINPQRSLKHSEKHLIKIIFLFAEALKRKATSPITSQSCLVASGKQRKFNATAKKRLERWFCSNIQYPYPNKIQILSLSKNTNLSIKQIQNWMSNRRRKSRKESIDSLLEPILNS
ncbi:Mating type alpha2 protein [Lachancea thermotolerans]